MNHYLSTGIHHFYTGQNACALAAAVLVFAIVLRARWPVMRGLMGAALVSGIAYADVTHPGVRGFFFDVPPIGQALQIACRKDGLMAFFDVYPILGRGVVCPKPRVCTPAVDRAPIVLDAIAGQPSLEQAIAVRPGQTSIRQTFKAAGDRLSGLFVFVGTFGHTFYDGYRLTLWNEGCDRVLADVSFPHLMEDGWELVRFPSIVDSMDRTYCVSISADRNAWHELVVYLSRPEGL